MMTKEAFYYYMSFIQRYLDESERVNEGLSMIADRHAGYINCDLGEDLFAGFVNLLSKQFDDQHKWIDYFIYECNFGKKPMEVTIDGKSFKLNSVSKLYKILNAKDK